MEIKCSTGGRSHTVRDVSVFTHGGNGQQVVIQLPPLCGELQRPLQVSAPQPQVHHRVHVTGLQVGLLWGATGWKKSWSLLRVLPSIHTENWDRENSTHLLPGTCGAAPAGHGTDPGGRDPPDPGHNLQVGLRTQTTLWSFKLSSNSNVLNKRYAHDPSSE